MEVSSLLLAIFFGSKPKQQFSVTRTGAGHANKPLVRPFRSLRRGSQLVNLTDTLSRHMRFLNLRDTLQKVIYTLGA
jgi:hypothetical protein